MLKEHWRQAESNGQEFLIKFADVPPHLYPVGRSAILQRLGMVTAISGLIPELFAVLESITAQRHFGFWPIFFTWLQHPSETSASLSCAADAQGASLKASMSGEDFPHSPAPWTPAMPRIATSTRKKMYFLWTAISLMHRAQINSGGFIARQAALMVLARETHNRQWTQHYNSGILFIAHLPPPQLGWGLPGSFNPVKIVLIDHESDICVNVGFSRAGEADSKAVNTALTHFTHLSTSSTNI